MLVNLKYVLDMAERGNFCVPAFNVYNMESVIGVLRLLKTKIVGLENGTLKAVVECYLIVALIVVSLVVTLNHLSNRLGKLRVATLREYRLDLLLRQIAPKWNISRSVKINANVKVLICDNIQGKTSVHVIS